jgi:hypothetical protein
MSPHMSNAVRYFSESRRARRRRGRKPIKRAAARRRKSSRPARTPQVLTLSSRRIPRRTMPEAVVPYLRLSGRWLAEHGFAIGANVEVVVEQSRVTLISRHEA